MKADYKGFVMHYREWCDAGIPVGMSDLRSLASKYNTPVPSFDGERLVFPD